jgi:DnaJ-class molecular chaperone
MEEERAVLVRFDARTKDGAELRVEGQGHAGGRGAPAGDVVVRISVCPR